MDDGVASSWSEFRSVESSSKKARSQSAFILDTDDSESTIDSVLWQKGADGKHVAAFGS